MLQNKFAERQISRISDFEIEVIVQDQNNFATKSLDCRNFVGQKIFRVSGAISFFDQCALENLWRLHRVKLMPIHRAGDHDNLFSLPDVVRTRAGRINVAALKRVVDWLSQ